MQICNFINLQLESLLQTEYMFFVVEPLLLEVSSCDWYPRMFLMGRFKRSLYCCLNEKEETEVFISHCTLHTESWSEWLEISLGVIKNTNATGMMKRTILYTQTQWSELKYSTKCYSGQRGPFLLDVISSLWAGLMQIDTESYNSSS